MRIQVWRSKLTQYKFKTRLVEGLDNIADYLSRCLGPNQQTGCTYKINALIAETEISVTESILRNIRDDVSLSVLKTETDNDQVLKIIRECILHKRHLPRSLEFDGYKSHMNEFSVDSNNLIMKGDQVVLPKSLWQRVINLAHLGHLGTSSCKRLIKYYYFIPNINKLVDIKVGSCRACELNTDYSHFNPIIASTMPSEKWNVVAIDFSSKTPTGEYILVMVCEHSRFPILKLTKRIRSSDVINILKKVFEEFGYPRIIRSDNGPAFVSREFAAFLKSRNISHMKVTPLWPRANGMVERFMKNINHVIRCAQIEGKPWKIVLDEFLKNYKATPHSMTGVAPNKLMQQPNENGMFHILEHDLDFYRKQALTNDKVSKQKMKHHADRNLKATQYVFNVNDYVYMHLNKEKKIKSNKFDSVVDPQLHQVKSVNGTMVTALNLKTLKPITRNACFFQLAKNIPPAEPLPLMSVVIRPAPNMLSTFDNMDTSLGNSQYDVPNSSPSFQSIEMNLVNDSFRNSSDTSDSTYEPPNRSPIDPDLSGDVTTSCLDTDNETVICTTVVTSTPNRPAPMVQNQEFENQIETTTTTNNKCSKFHIFKTKNDRKDPN